jgi:GNAT superfamily N-acetyltransferase
MTALVFRELTTADEVAAHLRLRRAVYTGTDLAFVAARGDDELAVDDYDAVSRLYGLYVDDVLAGGIRATRVPWQRAGHDLAGVVATRPALEPIVRATPRVPLPMMVDSPDADVLADFAENHRLAGTVVAEASRFMVGPAARGRGLGLLAAPTHIIECAIAAILVVDGADVAITGIRASHLWLYRRFGAEVIAGVSSRRGVFAEPVTSVEVSMATIAAESRHRIESFADQLATRGYAVR